MSPTRYFSICALARYFFDFKEGIQCRSSKLNFEGYLTFLPTFQPKKLVNFAFQMIRGLTFDRFLTQFSGF